MKIELQTTADGSPTLYLPDIDEHYHSVRGALAESMHVYIDLCWKEAVEYSKGNEIRVFEVGFGTGLNAALTAMVAAKYKINTRYYSIELYPLGEEVSSYVENKLNEDISSILQKVNQAKWDKSEVINPYFTLKKIHGDFLSAEIPEGLDAVYHDAFAPEKQPEMWNPEVMERLFCKMNQGGVLTTYCAKGEIRRRLSGIGFITERMPGPPGGKREVLRCRKI